LLFTDVVLVHRCCQLLPRVPRTSPHPSGGVGGGPELAVETRSLFFFFTDIVTTDDRLSTGGGSSGSPEH
jgi:hypothetical protein